MQLFYDFLSFLVVCIADDDWEPRGGQRGVSVVSHTQILGLFADFLMSQIKGGKHKRDDSFCLSIALTLEL